MGHCGNGGDRRRRGVAGVSVLAVLISAGAASADMVTSKGTVLHGTIKSLSSAGLVLAPEYGKGDLTIEWANVEDVRSDGNFQMLYGEEDELDAPLLGFADGKVLVGTDAATATSIDVKTIRSGVPIGAEGPSWQDRLRSSWRYWDGNFDVGFNAQQATTDTKGLLIGFKTTRKKDPLRLIFGGMYRYGTQTTNDVVCPSGGTCPPDPKTKQRTTTTTQDQLYGLMRGEYDILPRLYGFASGEGTYDAIQRLSIRAVPKAGLGYVFWEQILDVDHRNFLSGEVGPSWVYEKYFGGTHRDYVAIAFAAVTAYHLPYGAKFDGRVDYLPAVDDFVNDYLLRAEAALTMPLIAPISAKFSVIDEYDNTPAPGAVPNSLFLDLGLSVGW